MLPGYAKAPVGGYKVVFGYANYLTSLGCEVTICFLCEDTLRSFNLPESLRRLGSEMLTAWYPRWYPLDPRVKKKCIFSIDDESIPEGTDVVATAVQTAASVARLSPARGKKHYLVQDFETWATPEPEVRATYRLGMSNIVVSDWLKKLIWDESSVEPTLIKNPINGDVFFPQPDVKRYPHEVACLYNEGEHKGFDDLYQALLLVKREVPDLMVNCFGGPERPAWLPDWFRYTRSANEAQLREIYSRSAVYVCATVIEGFGLTLPESMFCGCALASTSFKGVWEYATEDCAMLSPVHDPVALAANVIALLQDPKGREAIAEAGRRHAMLECSMEKAREALNAEFGICSAEKARRRVGVITLPGEFNYGNRLQLYAVMSVWRRLGYNPVYLDRQWDDGPLLHPREAIRSLRQSLTGSSNNVRGDGRAAAFRRFAERIPTRSVANISSVNPAEFAYFSTGSDQVWNPHSLMMSCDASLPRRVYYKLVDPHELHDNMEWFFLGFAEPGQRITMAPSIGQDVLTGEECSWLRSGVRNFGRLSVRESKGAEIIRSCSGREATVVCDPTLVLGPDEWLSVADDRITPENSYVLSYILGDSSNELDAVLALASRNGEVPIVRLSDRSRPGEPDAGPGEFISLVANASYVVTDSFHASVFACIFERPLTIVRRRGQGNGAMFSRLQSLVSTLGVEDKVYGSPCFDPVSAGDYEGVPDAIGRERQRFMDYLEGCLDGRRG